MPGGRSPLNALTEAQAAGLRARLDGRMPVYVGMRNWHPYLHDALAAMARDGRRRALGVILSAFRCEASWERYMADVTAARRRVASAPEVVYAPPWFEHPRFVAGVADRIRTALAEVPEAERDRTPLVFTAHSIPRSMAEASPYVADFTAAASAVARRVGHPRWLLAYQSRSGAPRDPWLEPDIGETIRDLAKAGERRVIVVPIGFVVDHVEVLHDLDTNARATAARHGVAYHRAAAVNAHPEFIEMLAELVQQAQERTEPGRV
jgi:ferrochelatase